MTTSSTQTLHTREILDSHGNPTIEVDVQLEGDATRHTTVLYGLEFFTRKQVHSRSAAF
ncbi:MAG: hypothetical protein DYH16_01145 [Nitrosomonas sp. PRO5]|nr:hypothetical protein [Nitrosomonas sp. PRO5]